MMSAISKQRKSIKTILNSLQNKLSCALLDKNKGCLLGWHGLAIGHVTFVFQ